MNIIDTFLNFGSLTKRNKTNEIILHHAAAENCSPEDIHRWHLNNGWAGAGYHFLVRKDGKIYRLRPEWAVGAHASGSNSDSIGICAEGNYDYETMPEAQKNSLIWLVNYLKDKYGITKVIGHRDVNNTSCPGKNYPFNEIVNGTPSEDVKPTPTPQPSGNDKIKQVQEWLNNNYGTGIAIDGLYGPATKKALVKALQTEFNRQFGSGLSIDGIFGNATKNTCRNIKQGMSGNITKTIQGMLICRGYNTNGFDGIFGSGTANAVKQFQSNNGLSADGIVGKNTFSKLFG